jgi:hypothetical protein
MYYLSLLKMDLKPDMNYIMFDKIHNIIGDIPLGVMGWRPHPHFVGVLLAMDLCHPCPS